MPAFIDSRLPASIIAFGLAGCLAACGAASPGGTTSDAGTRPVTDARSVVAHEAGTEDAATHPPPLNGGHGAPQSLSITRASSTLTVTDAASPPAETLKALVTYSDHTTESVSASWMVDRPAIAGVGPASGALTPTGSTFGLVTVTAAALGLTATTTVAVAFDGAMNVGALSAADQTALSAATAADTLVTSFAYPYDSTVFPRGLLPPEQMWNGAATGDAYSIQYSAPPYFNLVVYVMSSDVAPDGGVPATAGRFTLPIAMWNSLASSAPGADVSVQLHRLPGGSETTAYVSAAQTWHIADADLAGLVYYWAVNEGEIYKLDLTTGTASAAFDAGAADAMGTPAPLDASVPPDASPWVSSGTGQRCVACHAVSKNGNKLTGVFASNSAAGPLGFVDTASGAVRAIGEYRDTAALATLTPDGGRAVENRDRMTMQLVDTATAAHIPSALDDAGKLCDPMFSPDGRRLALATECTGDSPVQFTASALTTYTYTDSPPYFADAATVLPKADAAIAYPSFSPDSQYIFFQRGDTSRAKYTEGSLYLHGLDDLWVTSAAPGSTPIELSNANNPGGTLATQNLHLNYAPTVNPISAGGYFWVVFTSPRDYGNEMVASGKPPRTDGGPPQDPTYSNRKQLWVTAVDANIGTKDPSHPPFWLPGQNPGSANMFGYWALAPCKADAVDAGAASCSAGFECCSGFCRDNTCVANPGDCSQIGEACSSSADCCNGSSGVTCSDGVCSQSTAK
jgi:hypothetical protein